MNWLKPEDFPSSFYQRYQQAFLEAMMRPEPPPLPPDELAKNKHIQRTINSILPKGYRCWVLRTLWVLIVRRDEHGERHTVVWTQIGDNRSASVAVNEINCYMANKVQITDCGRPASKRGKGPEFVLRLPFGDEKVNDGKG